MIDERPTPGDLSPRLSDLYYLQDPISPTLHDVPPERETQVLGPDGEPVRVNTPRRRVGFVLPHMLQQHNKKGATDTQT